MRGYSLPHFDLENPTEKLYALVYLVVKRKFPYLSDADYDEALGIGFLKVTQLLSKLDQFDNKKAAIQTWIFTAVYREIHWQLIRKNKPNYTDPDKMHNIEQTNYLNRHEIYSRWEEVKKVLYIHLSPKQRRIFDLRIQGYKNREIADIIGTTTTNVYLFLRRIEKKGRAITNA